MNIMDLSEREILALQYSLLEEMKQKPKETVVTATFNKEPTISAEEYIKQRFTDSNGNPETNDQYICRLKWFELGCPKYKKFANKIDYKYETLKNIGSTYKWQNIRTKAIELGYSHNKPNKFIDNTHKTIKRESKEYNRFRESVLKRDKVCQCCGSNEDLEVHHLFSFKNYNSLGADTKNGITLCKECHTQYHSQYGTKKNNNPVTFARFLRDYGMTAQSTLDNSSNDDEMISTEKLLHNIKEYQEDYAGECPIEVLVSDYKKFNIEEDVIQKGIRKLINKGLCYEPTKGYLRVVL